MTLNTRLDRLAAILKAQTPPARRYVRLVIDQEDMDSLPAVQADKLDQMVAAGAITEEQREDIDWIVRVIMPAPEYPADASPPPFDHRPLLKSITLPDDATTEPRRRKSPIEDRQPLDYSGVGYDDSKV